MKYRLVEDNGSYNIELYDRNGLFFGPKMWKKTLISTFLTMNTYKSSNILNCKLDMFTGLSFQKKEDAEFVYDYIVNYNTINDECLYKILGKEENKNSFNVLREN
jgi:hypothetical protein